MKVNSAVIAALAATLGAATLHAQVEQTGSGARPLPRLVAKDGRFALLVDDAPYLVPVSYTHLLQREYLVWRPVRRQARRTGRYENRVVKSSWNVPRYPTMPLMSIKVHIDVRRRECARKASAVATGMVSDAVFLILEGDECSAPLRYRGSRDVRHFYPRCLVILRREDRGIPFFRWST